MAYEQHATLGMGNSERERIVAARTRSVGGNAPGWQGWGRPSTKPTTSAKASSAPDLGAISDQLKSSQDAFVSARSADIDRDVERGMSAGMSNMIASGLAGTTAVGGMQAGLTEAATRAKANVAAGAQQRTDDLKFRYASLVQGAQEAAANRATSLAAADAGIASAAFSQPRNDTSGLERLVADLQSQIQQLTSRLNQSPSGGTSNYPNLGMVGQRAPSLL